MGIIQNNRSNEYMIECYHCGVEFKVVFDDDDAEVNFCPSCGIDTDASASAIKASQVEMQYGEDE